MTPPSGPRKILVAVDFGTTFSGTAWAETRRKVRTVIKDWPSGSGSDEKVPTKLQYDSQTFGEARTWGFEVEPDLARITYEMFKLGLDPKQEKQTQLARDYPSVVQPPSQSADIEYLVVDYLKALRENLEHQLDRLPNSMDLQSIPKQYTITVPAVWSEKAQAQTRFCAEKAGMGNRESIGIIAEPEAAAIHVLEELRQDEYRFKLNDTFVVCDAGGGTVDLISYTITRLKPILQVKEATKGGGYVCGGMFVNRVFAKYMSETYGDDPSWSHDVLEDAVQLFEQNIKRRFDGKTDKSYTLNVGIQNHSPDIRDSKLRLNGWQIRSFFDPVIDEIEKLVLAQIQATKQKVKCVVLVGGFGGNKYLYDRLNRAVGDAVRVSKPKNTLTAVVEGALIRALADAEPSSATIKVESRNARRYYGTSSQRVFVPGDDRNRRQWNSFTGECTILTMEWFVKQNEPVRLADPFSYYQYKNVSKGLPEEIRMYIYSYEALPNRRVPIYPDATGITQLGLLTVDVRDLPKAAIYRKRGFTGELFYIIDYDVQMCLHSAHLTFALLVQGIKYHELSLDFS